MNDQDWGMISKQKCGSASLQQSPPDFILILIWIQIPDLDYWMMMLAARGEQSSNSEMRHVTFEWCRAPLRHTHLASVPPINTSRIWQHLWLTWSLLLYLIPGGDTKPTTGWNHWCRRRRKETFNFWGVLVFKDQQLRQEEALTLNFKNLKNALTCIFNTSCTHHNILVCAK